MEIDTCKGRRFQLASVLALLVSTKGRFPPFFLRIFEAPSVSCFPCISFILMGMLRCSGLFGTDLMTILSS